MDVKGISWIGNVYQKFETMCLEVEEAVCQDTVKYVENQVKTVGTSVKKFYSEVVEDLVSPSLMDPVKVNSFSCIGTHKKPKVGIKEEAKKQSFDDPNATRKVCKSSTYPSSDNRFSNSDPAVTCNLVNSSDVLSSKVAPVSKGTGVSPKKLSLVSKRKPKSVIPNSTEMGKTTNPTAFNPSKKPQGSSALTNENSQAPTGQIFEHRCYNGDVNCGFKETEGRTGVGNQNSFKHKQATDALVKPVNVILPDGSVGSHPKELVEESSFVNMEWFQSMHCTETQEALTNSLPSDKSGKNDMDTTNKDVHGFGYYFAEESNARTGEIDGWNIETITSDDDVEEDMELVDMIFNKQVELGESVIIVDRENLPLNSDKELKQKSYKKKLRGVFSSRDMSMRKKEYRNLAVQYESTTNFEVDQHSGGSSLHTPTTSELKKLKSAQLCEPEWEIL